MANLSWTVIPQWATVLVPMFALLTLDGSMRGKVRQLPMGYARAGVPCWSEGSPKMIWVVNSACLLLLLLLLLGCATVTSAEMMI